MTEEKLARVVSQLLELSKAGKLNWEITVNDRAFQTNFEACSVRISERGDDDDISHVISIYQRDGTEIEAISIEALSNHLNGTLEATIMGGHLYNLARRNARGVDEALDSLLEQLNNR